MKYIDAEKLIERLEEMKQAEYENCGGVNSKTGALQEVQELIISLQQEQLDNMIQWTGNNLKGVIDFTGKSPKFGEWFKSWDEFESYVHSHGDILKLFSEDESHFEVPAGAWIVKTPDGHNVPSVARFFHAKQEQPEVGLKKEIELCWMNWLSPSNQKEVEGILPKTEFETYTRHFYELGKNARKEE